VDTYVYHRSIDYVLGNLIFFNYIILDFLRCLSVSFVPEDSSSYQSLLFRKTSPTFFYAEIFPGGIFFKGFLFACTFGVTCLEIRRIHYLYLNFQHLDKDVRWLMYAIKINRIF